MNLSVVLCSLFISALGFAGENIEPTESDLEGERPEVMMGMGGGGFSGGGRFGGMGGNFGRAGGFDRFGRGGGGPSMYPPSAADYPELQQRPKVGYDIWYPARKFAHGLLYKVFGGIGPYGRFSPYGGPVFPTREQDLRIRQWMAGENPDQQQQQQQPSSLSSPSDPGAQ